MAITDDLREVPIWVWPAGGAVLVGIALLNRRSTPAPTTSPVDPLTTTAPGNLTTTPDPNAGSGTASLDALTAFETQITDLLSKQSADSAAALTKAQQDNAAANASLTKQLADQAAAFAKQLADIIGKLPVSTPTPPAAPAPTKSDSVLAVAYDPRQDHGTMSGPNGTYETWRQRAIRQTMEFVQNHPGVAWWNALGFVMANISSDFARAAIGLQPDWNATDPGNKNNGTSPGWNINLFRYNDYGEQYNPNIDYWHRTRKLNPDGTVTSNPNGV